MSLESQETSPDVSGETSVVEPGSEPSLVDEIRNLSRQAPTPEQDEPAGEPTEEPSDQPTEEEKEPSPEERVRQLERIIAMDPLRRDLYRQQLYGLPPVAPAPQQPQQAPPAQPEGPFDYGQLFRDSEFDPTDPNHFATVLNKVLEPFSAFVESQRQENEQYRAQEHQQAAAKLMDDLNRQAEALLDKQAPGYAELSKKPPSALTADEQVFVDYVQRLFESEVKAMFPPAPDGSHVNAWVTPDVHKEAIRRISPKVTELGVKLGVVKRKASASINREVSMESYVEPSGSVPSEGKKNPFQAAMEKDDLVGMISNLSKRAKK